MGAHRSARAGRSSVCGMQEREETAKGQTGQGDTVGSALSTGAVAVRWACRGRVDELFTNKPSRPDRRVLLPSKNSAASPQTASERKEFTRPLR